MSGNNKSHNKTKIVQIIFIILGMAAIVAELLYLFNIFPIRGKQESEADNTAQTVISATAVNNNTEKETQKEKHTIEKYVFVGDSRYVGMSMYKESEDTFIAKNNMGYSYLEEQMSLIKKSCDKNTALIIGLGVNDLKYSKEQYIQTLNNMAKEMDCKIYYMLVNPVDEKKEASYGYSVENKVIKEFNASMKEELSSDISIIDTNSYLEKEGYVTVDGLHYDNDTYKLIYDYIKKSVVKEY